MNFLSNKELSQVSGGGNTLWIVLGGLGVLLTGVLAGFVNPTACKKK